MTTLDSAYEKCEQLANSHYENFPVAKMVPKRLRRHVAALRERDDEHGDESAGDDAVLDYAV